MFESEREPPPLPDADTLATDVPVFRRSLPRPFALLFGLAFFAIALLLMLFIL